MGISLRGIAAVVMLGLIGHTFFSQNAAAQQGQSSNKTTASIVAIVSYFLQDDTEQVIQPGGSTVVIGRGGPGEIHLSWGPVDGALGYDLYYSNESFGSPAADIANYSNYANAHRVQNILTTEYVLTDFENYKLYYFVIVAQHPSSGSAPLEEVVAIPEVTRNDTGVTRAGLHPMGVFEDCTVGAVLSQQDCSHGRDTTHNDDTDGLAGLSFTKLDASGNQLPLEATQWSCVQDNVSGLVWEVKNDDGGIHDKDTAYRWGGTGALGSGYGSYYSDWTTLVDGSNSQELCGFADWRVPLAKELVSITSYRNDQNNANSLPSIDSNFFPNTPMIEDYPPACYWSAIPYASDFITSGEERAWCVQVDGYVSDYSRSHPELVRLVRGGQ